MDLPHRLQYRSLIWGAALLTGMVALLCWPEECMDAMRSGLSLCGNILLPSLFPFFVLSSLVVELGLARCLGRLLEPVMDPVFRLGGGCAGALVLGFIGGYPVGAKTTLELYQSGACSKAEAQRLLAFCNNSGPAYVLGVVGVGVFGSSTIGFLLYAVHLISALLIGALFRFYQSDKPPSPSSSGWSIQTVSASTAFTRSVTGALSSCLNICAFVLFFAVILRCLALSGWMNILSSVLRVLLAPFDLSQTQTIPLLTGLLEISSGVSALAGTGTLYSRIILASLLLGWGGVCVHCQVLSLLCSCALSPRTYFAGKALHALFSTVLTGVFLTRFPLSQAASCLNLPADSIMSDFGALSSLSLLFSLSSCLLLFVCMIHLRKKSSRKGFRHRV